MQQKTYYPWRVWTFSILVSAVIAGVIHGWILSDEFFLLQTAFIHSLFGFTLVIPFYFVWIYFARKILKSSRDLILKKKLLSLTASIIVLVTFFSFQYLFPEYEAFEKFDCISFGVILILSIWLYSIEYEIEIPRHEILDDNFHQSKY